MNKLKKITSSDRLTYLVLFLLCVIPQALFLGKHGFYWDDWSQILVHTKYGDGTFWEYLSYGRPLSAWTRVLFFPLCGASPVRWHILFTVLKYLLCCLFYLVLRETFPEQKSTAALSAVLTAVCPLFSQQHISVAYSQHYTDFVLYAASVFTLIRSLKAGKTSSKVLWYILSTLCMLLHLTISEYFAFLELLKFPILWIILSGKERSGFLKSLKAYAPQLVVFIGYCLFRMNISKFYPQFDSDTPRLLALLLRSPAQGSLSLVKNALINMLYPFTVFISGLFAFDLQRILSLHAAFFIVMSSVSGLVAAVNFTDDKEEKQQTRERLQTAGLGILGMALGFVPFWVMNESVFTAEDIPHADRCFLAALPFVCLLTALLIRTIFPKGNKLRAGIFIAVFLFTHSLLTAGQNAANLTASQNSFYHQMALRAPGLESGTAVVDDTIIFPDQGNFATAAALNTLYPNGIPESGQVPFWAFSYDRRVFEQQGGFSSGKRIFSFNRPPSSYIYVDHDNRFANCTWVFGPEDTDNPHVTELQRSWIANTAIGRIDINAELIPDPVIYGKVPDGWCTHYQKAALLRQKQDWAALADLAHTVLDLGYTPADNRSNAPFEWWPFIEGLYRSGETETAEALAAQAVQIDEAYKDFFTNRMEKISGQNNDR